MSAYHEIYLNSAMSRLGEMFDFAINDFGISRDDFPGMFAMSSVSRRIEVGEPRFLVGMSGVELACEVILETTGITPVVDPEPCYFRTPDHWCGRTLSYYQWLRAMKFRDIFREIPYDDIYASYRTLHEADITKFVDIADERIRKNKKETNLKIIRTTYGYSQRDLSRMSGVSLRSIQMYEQRRKDINKGQADTVMSLSRALGCRMEDLLEQI